MIRSARADDLAHLIAIEAECFPAAEAATPQALAERLAAFGDRFLVYTAENDIPIGFINGSITNQRTISDDMFESVSLHDEKARYQAIFGLDVLPDYRRQGIAAQLMNALINKAKAGGQAGVILTCKEHLLHYYAKFGFQNLGLSQSVHGGAVWYDMLLEFE